MGQRSILPLVTTSMLAPLTQRLSPGDEPLTVEHRLETRVTGNWWPGVFEISAGTAFLSVVGVMGLGWLWFILHDLVRILGPVEYPVWVSIFATDRPIEWLQWFVLITGAVLAAWLAGRLNGGPARFFLLMAVGIALIFLEDASHLRSMLYLEYSSAWFGSEVAGVPTRIASDSAYSAAIMLVPAFVLLRYARHIWPCPAARNYMISGFLLYALVSLLAALRHVDGLYARLGESIDAWLFASRWPASPQVPDDMQYFYVVDAAVKETLELLGAACFLAMVLAYANWRRRTEGDG